MTTGGCQDVGRAESDAEDEVREEYSRSVKEKTVSCHTGRDGVGNVVEDVFASISIMQQKFNLTVPENESVNSDLKTEWGSCTRER